MADQPLKPEQAVNDLSRGHPVVAARYARRLAVADEDRRGTYAGPVSFLDQQDGRLRAVHPDGV
jgi:hypothetical protein